MYDRIRIVTTANSDRGLIAMFIEAWENCHLSSAMLHRL